MNNSSGTDTFKLSQQSNCQPTIPQTQQKVSPPEPLGLYSTISLVISYDSRFKSAQPVNKVLGFPWVGTERCVASSAQPGWDGAARRCRSPWCWICSSRALREGVTGIDWNKCFQMDVGWGEKWMVGWLDARSRHPACRSLRSIWATSSDLLFEFRVVLCGDRNWICYSSWVPSNLGYSVKDALSFTSIC